MKLNAGNLHKQQTSLGFYFGRVARFGTICNFKNVKNTHGGVLHLVKLQAEASNFTNSDTPPWMFFTFSKLYKWYQIAQSVSFILCKFFFRFYA